MAQDALNRWWWPSLMMFGPPDAASVHSAQSARWKIKLLSNDELRQRFVDQTVPQADYLGLQIPDPELAGTRRAAITISATIDWDEFHEVIKGNGPCNRDRLRTRVAGVGRAARGCARRRSRTRQKRAARESEARRVSCRRCERACRPPDIVCEGQMEQVE